MSIFSCVIPAKSTEIQQLPIIMLHGWGRSHADFLKIADLLSEHSDVHLIDLPGFGKSSPPPLEGWDTTQFAAEIGNYLIEKNVTKAIFVGHSLGGRISLRIAVQRPELVVKLILIGSHGLRPIRSIKQNIRIYLIKKLARLVKFADRCLGTSLFDSKFAKKFGSPDYQNAGILKNTFVKTVNEDQAAEVRKVMSPTLLLWGNLDNDTPPAMGRKFHQLIKQSRLIIMDNKDHYPFLGAGAHLCASYILEFISDTIRRP